MNKRNGMSMAEVLVALFLLALGTIAILTMFPLGMYHMGQALKDDRTAQSAQQADAFMRMYWRMNVVENPFARNTLASGYPGYEPLVLAFDNPDSQPGVTAVPPAPIALGGRPNIANQPVPSYPVFVDPMGWYAPWNTLNPSGYQMQYWAGQNHGVYPRRSLNLLLNQGASAPAASQRACSLMDGFSYAENGAPTGNPGITVERELRYNWMWLLQRPDNSVHNTASMTIVVFDKRAFLYAPQNAEQVIATQYPGQPFTVVAPNNVNYTAPGNANNTIVMQPLITTLQVPVALGVPPVQKGGWIMDASYQPAGVTAPFGMRHAIFYRVVSVTDNPNNTVIANGVPTAVPTTDIELQTPIRRMDGSNTAYPGTLIFFAGVSEVFERPSLSPKDF